MGWRSAAVWYLSLFLYGVSLGFVFVEGISAIARMLLRQNVHGVMQKRVMPTNGVQSSIL